jgi:hypothetical protein
MVIALVKKLLAKVVTQLAMLIKKKLVAIKSN